MGALSDSGQAMLDTLKKWDTFAAGATKMGIEVRLFKSSSSLSQTIKGLADELRRADQVRAKLEASSKGNTWKANSGALKDVVKQVEALKKACADLKKSIEDAAKPVVDCEKVMWSLVEKVGYVKPKPKAFYELEDLDRKVIKMFKGQLELAKDKVTKLQDDLQKDRIKFESEALPPNAVRCPKCKHPFVPEAR